VKKWLEKRRKQKCCLHHDMGGNPANSHPAESWIKQVIIDCGRAKMFWCTYCEKTWII
jgi:hypothetical protein